MSDQKQGPPRRLASLKLLGLCLVVVHSYTSSAPLFSYQQSPRASESEARAASVSLHPVSPLQPDSSRKAASSEAGLGTVVSPHLVGGPAVTLTVTPDHVHELDKTTEVTLTVILDEAQSDDTALTLDWGGTAEPSADYSFSGARPTSLVIAAGDTNGTVEARIRPRARTWQTGGDHYTEWGEGPETIEIVAKIDELEVASASIVLYDTVVTLFVDTDSVGENDGTTEVLLAAWINETRAEDTQVEVTFGGEATLGTDYTISPDPLNPVTVTIPARQLHAHRTFLLTPAPDVLSEGAEDIEPVGAVKSDDIVVVAAGSITLDDSVVMLRADRYLLWEDDGSSTLSLTARLSHHRQTPTTVDLRLGGTAVQGTDYTVGALPVLTIPAGMREVSGSVTLQPTGDLPDESLKTISLGGEVRNSTTVAVAPATLTLMAAGVPREPAVLMSIYHATGGPSWTGSQGGPQWHVDALIEALGPGPAHPPRGVTVNNDRQVTGLGLYNNRLGGPIPPEIGQLVQLRSLVMQGNQLWGPIPDLSALTQLRQLDLRNNRLSGEIPDLGALTQLDALSLAGNQLSGGIPDLSTLAQLRLLQLGRNRLSGEIPSWVGTFSAELVSLGLSHNLFTGAVPDLSGLPKLWDANLTSNKLTGELPATPIFPSGLAYLELSDNQLAGEIPSWIGTFSTELDGLWLSRNQFTGAIPDLSGLAKLRYLSVDGNELTGEIPDLSGLTQLQELYADNNGLAGEIPWWLGNLTELRILSLSDNDLTGELPDLSRLEHLRELYLDNNRLCGSIPENWSGMSRLRLLWTSGNRLQGAIPDALTQLRLRTFAADSTLCLTGSTSSWYEGVPNPPEGIFRTDQIDKSLTTVCNLDRTPPQHQAITVHGRTVVIRYDETLSESSTPDMNAFAVTVGESSLPMADVVVKGSEVRLVLTKAVLPGQPVKVSYTPPANGPVLQDLICNACPPLVAEDTGSSAPPSPDSGDDDDDDSDDGDDDGDDDSDDDGDDDSDPEPLRAAIRTSADCMEGLCRARTDDPVMFWDASTGPVESRLWSIGSWESRRPTVSYTWSDPGFYEVVLRVSDGPRESTASLKLLVEASNPAGTCVADAETLCFLDSRFAVEMDWWWPGDDRVGPDSGRGKIVPEGTNYSGMFYFHEQENWEVLVKVLDGCWYNDHVWVYGASATNLGYSIRVTDTVTGAVREYRNEEGRAAEAITDSSAFPDVCGAPSLAALRAAVSAPFTSASPMNDPSASRVLGAEVGSENDGCTETETALCLLEGRYEVSVEWSTLDGERGVGRVLRPRTTDSGLFEFFAPQNWEMMVKVLDGCWYNERHWVFAASATDLGLDLVVRDTVTGQVKHYTKDPGRAAPAITDTGAFSDGCKP